jgi:hypothetical protein
MAKGLKTGGGSRKGAPNKLNKPLFEMIDMALEGVGGVEYLKIQAIENPTAFLALVGKRLPRDVSLQGKVEHIVAVHQASDAELLTIINNGG